MKSTSIYSCASCGKVVGGCMEGHDHGAPLILFLDDGEKGMVVFCVSCFNELELMEARLRE